MLGFMFLYGCSQKEYLLFDFLKINEYDIKKIEIRKSGYMEPVYISTEGEKIKECVKQLKSIHIVEKSNTDKDINGWMYRIVLSLSDNTIDISVNGKYINIDYNYFECDEKDIKNLFEYLEAIARPYRNEGHDESSNSRQSLPEFDTIINIKVRQGTVRYLSHSR